MSFEVGTKVATEKASITTLPHSLGQQDNLALYLAIPFLKKMGQPRPLFCLFSSFQTNNKYECENDHPVSGTGIRTHKLLITSLLP